MGEAEGVAGDAIISSIASSEHPNPDLQGFLGELSAPLGEAEGIAEDGILSIAASEHGERQGRWKKSVDEVRDEGLTRVDEVVRLQRARRKEHTLSENPKPSRPVTPTSAKMAVAQEPELAVNGKWLEHLRTAASGRSVEAAGHGVHRAGSTAVKGGVEVGAEKAKEPGFGQKDSTCGNQVRLRNPFVGVRCD